MNENENIVVEEQVEQPVEQTAETPAPKLFTQDEVNEIVSRREARTRAKVEKENQRKYGGLMEVLRALKCLRSLITLQRISRFWHGQKPRTLSVLASRMLWRK